MSVTISPHTRRTCERCGREEAWDDDAGTWRVADDAGSVYCVHEWDVNGSYLPLEE